MREWRSRQAKKSANLVRRDARIFPVGDPTKALSTAVTKANLGQNFTLHDARRICSSRLVALGASPKTVQEVTGHKTIGVLMNNYVKSTRDQKREAIRLLNSTRAVEESHANDA